MADIMVLDAVIGHEEPRGWREMSSSVFLMSLRDGEGKQAGTLLPWLAGFPSAHGVPARLPEPHPLPSARAVVEALVGAHCHGTSWTALVGVDGDPLACPDPARCAGHDLGEVSLHREGVAVGGLGEPVPPDAPIECVSCRRAPVPDALVAACALAAISGPWIVYPDTGGRICVVWPGDRPEALAAEWDWA